MRKVMRRGVAGQAMSLPDLVVAWVAGLFTGRTVAGVVSIEAL
jgi:hypothetical protein